MSQLVLFAHLVGLEHGSAPRLVEPDTAGALETKVTWLELPLVDHGKGDAVREHGTKLLHQVERQAGSTGPFTMQEAHLRVETCRLRGRGDVMHQQGVEQGEHRVHSVERRTPRASPKTEVLFIRLDQVVKDPEIGPGGFALEAADRIHVEVR